MKIGPVVVYRRQGWLGVFGMLMLLSSTVFMLAACNAAAWTDQAISIINVLEPAILAALGIVSAFGFGVPANDLENIQKWAAEATNTLANVVKPLITEYTAAAAAAQPGILNEITAGLQVVTTNISAILAAIHVTDPVTQGKIQTVITTIADEVQALIGLIPVVQGTVTAHEEVHKLMAALKSAKGFKSEFNSAAAPFGKQYEI